MKFSVTPAMATKLRRNIAVALMLCSAALATNVSASGGGGGGSGSGTATTGKVNYFPIDPAFVVNIRDNNSLRFMQVSLNLMTMDAEVVAAVQKHMAPIRHELLMLFSSREMSEVMSVQAREVLRRDALNAVQGVLEHYADISGSKKVKDAEGKEVTSGVQEVLFTSFVIQ